jgi:hypothetical protein
VIHTKDWQTLTPGHEIKRDTSRMVLLIGTRNRKDYLVPLKVMYSSKCISLMTTCLEGTTLRDRVKPGPLYRRRVPIIVSSRRLERERAPTYALKSPAVSKIYFSLSEYLTAYRLGMCTLQRCGVCVRVGLRRARQVSWLGSVMPKCRFDCYEKA